MRVWLLGDGDGAKGGGLRVVGGRAERGGLFVMTDDV